MALGQATASYIRHRKCKQFKKKNGMENVYASKDAVKKMKRQPTQRTYLQITYKGLVPSIYDELQ